MRRNLFFTHSLKTEPSMYRCRKPSGPSALAASPINLASAGTSTVRNPNHRTAFRLTRGARLTLCLTLVFIVSCAAPGERAGDVQASTEAIRLQIGKYTAALDTADTNLASQVWLTSPEVSFIHPAGHQHGWEEVKGFYTFFGSSFSE